MIARSPHAKVRPRERRRESAAAASAMPKPNSQMKGDRQRKLAARIPIEKARAARNSGSCPPQYGGSACRSLSRGDEFVDTAVRQCPTHIEPGKAKGGPGLRRRCRPPTATARTAQLRIEHMDRCRECCPASHAPRHRAPAAEACRRCAGPSAPTPPSGLLASIPEGRRDERRCAC